MTFTVTRVTISIVTMSALNDALALTSTLLLILLLIQKEVVNALSQDWAERLRRSLNIVIVPLLISFAFLTVYKLVGAFQ